VEAVEPVEVKLEMLVLAGGVEEVGELQAMEEFDYETTSLLLQLNHHPSARLVFEL
jgi:hypothetical protein